MKFTSTWSGKNLQIGSSPKPWTLNLTHQTLYPTEGPAWVSLTTGQVVCDGRYAPEAGRVGFSEGLREL